MINLKKKPILVEEIKSLNEKIIHRGPDNEGYLLKDHFAFGHRRLSILDKSASGNQPMKCRDFSIIYNGEVYNYLELKQELTELGYNFISNTDTEVVVAAYSKWGVRAFEKFNGMWAFAIYDSIKNEIIVCRDNFGIKPVNYTVTENYFLLGSEIKQFTSHPEFKKVLNKKVAIDFLKNGALNQSEETFFENVFELKSGHFLKFNLSNNQYKIKQWYNLKEAKIYSTDQYQTAKIKLKSIFEESVKIRMRSDVVVGSCLSGGLDSSSIVCTIKENQLNHKDFATVTSCYKNNDFDEQIFSDEVTKYTNFNSLKTYPTSKSLFEENVLDKMIYHHDQPILAASHFAEYCVCKKAKENDIIVLLDGQASDEILCGYPKYDTAYVKELFLKFRYIKIFKLLKNKVSNNNTKLKNEIKFLLFTFIFIPISKLVKKNNEYITEIEKYKNTNTEKISSIVDLSILEIEKISLPYQIHSLDRNSMMFSIEARLPFLDKNLVEYSIGLPTAFKIKNSMRKFILRDAITSLPLNIRNRKDKMAYEAPEEIWVREYKEYFSCQLTLAVSEFEFISQKLLFDFENFINNKIPYNPIFFRIVSFYRFYLIFNLKK